MDCVFCKVIDKRVPAKLLYEDDDVIVFPDIHPVRPVHLLIVPKQHITEMLTVEEPVLFQKIFTVAQNMIKREGLKDEGYRVTLNGGGSQLVDHFHVHIMGPMKSTDSV